MTETKKAQKPAFPGDMPVGDAKKDAEEVQSKESRKREIRITRDLLENKGPLRVSPDLKKPGMEYFWMKDGPGRFQELSKRGYDFVTDDDGNKISEGRVGETLYLLEIPKEYYDQIRKIKAEIRHDKTRETRSAKDPSQTTVEGIYEKHLTVK